MNLATRDLMLLICSAALALIGCVSSPHHPAITASAAELQLSAKMPDAQIIRALGFDPQQFEPHRSYGADGRGTAYKSADGQWISITRSVFDGTVVTVWDAHGQQGRWDLGFR